MSLAKRHPDVPKPAPTAGEKVYLYEVEGGEESCSEATVIAVYDGGRKVPKHGRPAEPAPSALCDLLTVNLATSPPSNRVVTRVPFNDATHRPCSHRLAVNGEAPISVRWSRVPPGGLAELVAAKRAAK